MSDLIERLVFELESWPLAVADSAAWNAANLLARHDDKGDPDLATTGALRELADAIRKCVACPSLPSSPSPAPTEPLFIRDARDPFAWVARET